MYLSRTRPTCARLTLTRSRSALVRSLPQEEHPWSVLKPEIFAAITEHYDSLDPIMYEGETEATTINDDDSETVAMIKELLETRIRPAVQEDGGDIVFVAFDEATGVVTIKMLGACDGCPSSSITLKSGVENMIKVSVEDSHESARMPRLTVLTRYTLQALRPRGDGDTGGGTGRGGEGGAPGLQRAGAAVVHIECFTRGRGRGP